MPLFIVICLYDKYYDIVTDSGGGAVRILNKICQMSKSLKKFAFRKAYIVCIITGNAEFYNVPKYPATRRSYEAKVKYAFLIYA